MEALDKRYVSPESQCEVLNEFFHNQLRLGAVCPLCKGVVMKTEDRERTLSPHKRTPSIISDDSEVTYLPNLHTTTKLQHLPQPNDRIIL